MGVHQSRSLWLSTTGLSAVALAFATPAVGQESAVDAGQAPESEQPGEIVVTGQRAADRNAIDAKRQDARVVDVISADDVGKVTDLNAGEALRRVAGINTWSYLGEPRFVTIRGFNTSYNTTTVDGFQFASPDNANYGGGRQFYMDALPSNVASRIEVFKTSTPAMEGHSVGGTINFVVPDALDMKRDRTNVTVRGGLNFNKEIYGTDRPTYQGELMFARKFGPDKQFGITLIGSHWRRKMNIAQYEIGGDAYSFGPATKSGGLAVVQNPYGGQFGYYPSQLTWHNYDNDRYRTSFVGKLSWEPADGQRFAVNGYYLEQGEEFSRNSRYIDTAQGGSNFDGRNFSDGYAEIDNSASQYEILSASFTRKIYGGNATYTGTLSDDFSTEVRAGYSEATFTNPQLFNRFVLPAANNEYWAVRRDGDYFLWSPIGDTFAAKLANFSNYTTSNGGGQSGAGGGRNLEEGFATTAKLFQTATKLAYNMERRDYGFGVEIGAALSTNRRSDDYNRTDYGNATNGINMAQVFTGNYICAPGCVGTGIALLDADKIRQIMATLPSTINTSAIGNRYTTRETIAAGYGMLRYKGERFEVIGGIRFEDTDYFTSGFTLRTPAGGGTAAYLPVSATDHSSNWLPSITAIYDASANIRFRAAYSRTIGRPSLTQKSMRGGALNETASPPTLTQGNPDLLPRTADNFDVIGEWYFNGGEGIFTLGAFYKRVKNEIYRSQSLQTIDGTQYFATIPVNSPFAATVKGIEFNFVMPFTFLPGKFSNFGIQANGVVLDTKFPILLQGGTRVDFDTMPDQAKYATNLAVYYEDKGGFSARVAWNHVGTSWDGRIGGNTNLPSVDLATADALYRVQYNTPRDSIDLKVSKEFGRFNVSLNANNLLNQGADTNFGSDQEIPGKRLYVPTTVLLGVSFDF